MHDAYEPVPILEKLPLQIDCLAAWGELLTLYLSHSSCCDIEVVPSGCYLPAVSDVPLVYK